MGILSKMTSSASMGINLGAMLAKHLSMATLSALDTTLQTTKEVSELAFEYVDDTVPMLDEVSTIQCKTSPPSARVAAVRSMQQQNFKTQLN